MLESSLTTSLYYLAVCVYSFSHMDLQFTNGSKRLSREELLGRDATRWFYIHSAAGNQAKPPSVARQHNYSITRLIPVTAVMPPTFKSYSFNVKYYLTRVIYHKINPIIISNLHQMQINGMYGNTCYLYRLLVQQCIMRV